MPILGTLFALRMDALNDEQAQKNHGQTLARLAERGGLALNEATAIAERRKWRDQRATEAVQALQALVASPAPAAPSDAAGVPKPAMTLLEDQAVSVLNTVKAWRDSDGNEAFPHETRMQIDALLAFAEQRRKL